MQWEFDNANKSWFGTDRDGTFIRVSKSWDVRGESCWALAWTEACGGSRLRIGAQLHKTAEDAKAHAERTIILSPGAETDAMQQIEADVMAIANP